MDSIYLKMFKNNNEIETLICLHIDLKCDHIHLEDSINIVLKKGDIRIKTTNRHLKSNTHYVEISY